MELVWLFGEARSRQRKRRRRRVAWSLVGLFACVITARVTTGRIGSPPAHSETRVPLLAPSAVFTRTPYMGVRCPAANSIACDRVGLAIWLRRPAVRVRATIAGQPLALDWFGDERRVGRVPARRQLDGYLQPAHIVRRLGVHPSPGGMWYGPRAGRWPTPLVRVTITFADGQRVATRLRVALSSGWG